MLCPEHVCKVTCKALVCAKAKPITDQQNVLSTMCASRLSLPCVTRHSINMEALFLASSSCMLDSAVQQNTNSRVVDQGRELHLLHAAPV